MKRKIIKQGHNTLTITLPSEWTKKLNLKPGDEVELNEKNDNLTISGKGKTESKTATIDITDFNTHLLWVFIQSAYRSGCSEIKINFDQNKKDYPDPYHFYTSNFDYTKFGEKIPPKPALAMIQSIVDRFIGMGIIQSGKGYCIIREMGEPTLKEFDNSLRRIFLVILQLFERVIEAIENNEIKEANLCKEIHTIDLNIDRFVDYCCRILNETTGHFSENKKTLLFSTLYILELLGDEFKYIGKHLAVSKKPIKTCLELSKMIKEYFNTYYKIFYKFDRDLTIQLSKQDYEIYSKNFKYKEEIINKKINGENKSIAGHLMQIGKNIWALSELRIGMEYSN